MKVKDLILWQVATDKNFVVGQILDVGQEPNGQFYKCQHQSFLTDDGIVLHEAAFDSAHHGVFKDKKAELERAKALLEYDFILRELALEEVRREKFADLPSRFRCMFFSDNEEECLKNFEDFKKNKPDAKLQAVKVKLTGDVHFVRHGVGRNGWSYSEYLKEAEKFWREGVDTEGVVREVLGQGKLEILEIIKTN